MTQSWLIGAMENYRDAVERGQRRLLEAQHDACVAVVGVLPDLPAVAARYGTPA